MCNLEDIIDPLNIINFDFVDIGNEKGWNERLKSEVVIEFGIFSNINNLAVDIGVGLLLIIVTTPVLFSFVITSLFSDIYLFISFG